MQHHPHGAREGHPALTRPAATSEVHSQGPPLHQAMWEVLQALPLQPAQQAASQVNAWRDEVYEVQGAAEVQKVQKVVQKVL